MDSAQALTAVFGAIAFSIPIFGALWKIFTVREQLQVSITANSHRLEMMERDIGHLADQQALALNGIKELVQHVRSRSQHSEEALDRRLDDVEKYLAKSTSFEPRNQG